MMSNDTVGLLLLAHRDKGTKRMFGRCAASQIASASATSFFCRFTNGLTYAGGISRTVLSQLADLSANRRRLPSRTTQGACAAKNSSRFLRTGRRRG